MDLCLYQLLNLASKLAPKVNTVTVLSDRQLRRHNEELNRAIDVLIEVSTAVRHACPPDDRIHLIVRNASDAIVGVNAIRVELEELRHQIQNPTATDIEDLYKQFEQRVLHLDGVKPAYPQNEVDGVGFGVPGPANRQFVRAFLRKRKGHLSLELYIPSDTINDPQGMCEKKKYYLAVKFSSVESLDYVMGLV